MQKIGYLRIVVQSSIELERSFTLSTLKDLIFIFSVTVFDDNSTLFLAPWAQDLGYLGPMFETKLYFTL